MRASGVPLVGNPNTGVDEPVEAFFVADLEAPRRYFTGKDFSGKGQTFSGCQRNLPVDRDPVEVPAPQAGVG